MENNYLIVCFYTTNTPYELESQGLKRSCEQFGLPCYRKGYSNHGTWVRNAGIKPKFLLEMLEEHAGRDLLYLDADARIRQHPTYFDNFDGDIGVHFLKGPKTKELLSGTIYLKNTPSVKQVIETWVEAQAREPNEWDQRVFAKVLNGRKNVKIIDIPAPYCQIFDAKSIEEPPVIEQMQASRCYKTLVDHRGSKLFSGHPVAIGKTLVRTATDGTLYLTEPDPIAEKHLDDLYSRIPGTLRWRVNQT